MAHVLSPDGAIARRLEGFEVRPQQVEMATAVERTMAEGGHLLVEAGTGVGKSFAYLLPAIRRIVEHSERVVIATNTINLQEQLIEKDIPLLNAVIPEEFSAVLVKGRNNYISLRRLKLASERQDRLFTGDNSRHELHVLENWAYNTRDGSLADMEQSPRMDVWDHVRSDTHNCMGRKCPTYDKCFYQSARRRMENGDLLVCNHALFFADLALRTQGVGFLPPYDHVILDEGHRIEEVAAEHFGLSLAESRVAHLLNVLYRPSRRQGFLTAISVKGARNDLVDQSIQQTLVCRHASDEFFGRLIEWQKHHGAPNGRIREGGVVPNGLSDPMKQLADALRVLKEHAAGEPDQYELNSYSTRAQEIARDTEFLIQQQIDDCVYWLEGAGDQADARRPFRRVTLNCVAIDVSEILRERLFGQDISVTVTSATLAAAREDFSHIASRLGCEAARTLQLGSPFDHAGQMKVFIDREMPEPTHPQYIERLCPRIEQLVRQSQGGAFVLFTSFAMLDRVADRLRPTLLRDGYPVLVQGKDGPPGLLLKRFKQDQRSVLLGTSSFWQGVDVRGRGLRLVIITRLPFDVPDRPVIEARHERIRERGGNPFIEDQVPKAVLRFRQGIGRLIRSSTDEGIVAILDPRIVTKFYGRAFFEALPEGVEVSAIEDDFGPNGDRSDVMME